MVYLVAGQVFNILMIIVIKKHGNELKVLKGNTKVSNVKWALLDTFTPFGINGWSILSDLPSLKELLSNSLETIGGLGIDLEVLSFNSNEDGLWIHVGMLSCKVIGCESLHDIPDDFLGHIRTKSCMPEFFRFCEQCHVLSFLSHNIMESHPSL